MPLDSIRDRFPTEPEVDLGGKSARQYMDSYDTRNIAYGSPYDQKDLGKVGQGLSDAYMSSIMELPMMAMEYLMPDDPYEAGVLQSGPQDRMREGEFKWQEHMEGQSQDPSYATGQDFGQALGVIADPFIDAPLMGIPALGKMMKLSPDTTAKMGSGVMGRLMDETGALVGQRGMEKLGVDPASDLVGQYSGLWDKGVRAELDDVGSATHPLILEGDVSDWSMGSMGIDVKETMSHPSLYQAYEELGSLPTQGNIQGGIDDLIGALSGQKRSNVQGSYSPKGITLNTSPEGIKPVMAHELTHGVQDAEGFARGGSPQEFGQQDTAEMARSARSWAKEVRRLKKEMPNADNYVIDNRVAEQYKEMGAEEWIPSREVRELANQPYVLFPEHYPEQAKEMEDLIELYGLNRSVSTKTDKEMYQRLAGEWEARNIGDRASLSADDKRLGEVVEKLGVKFRAGQPFSTADNFALEDLIVRMK